FADLTVMNFVLNNLIPVTLGNIVGGGVFIGLGYWMIENGANRYSAQDNPQQIAPKTNADN
ncbi:formate/nitrite transporter family protein, partial [Shewanella sp. 0m-11]